jgi:hypothetical protein
MKSKMTKLLAMFAVAISAMTFTSCDDDADVAYLLEGAWSGNMYVHSSYNGHIYDATYTEIEFFRDYDSGDGVWIDYYSNAPWDYVANHITWRVVDQNIYIHFVEDGVNAVIYDYSIDYVHGEKRFTGYIEIEGGDYADFSLTQIASPNWDSYPNWGYDDWGYGWNKAGNDSLPITRGATNLDERPKRIFQK